MGGATGGGHARVVPESDIDRAAYNLVAAILDHHVYHGNSFHVVPAESGNLSTVERQRSRGRSKGSGGRREGQRPVQGGR